MQRLKNDSLIRPKGKLLFCSVRNGHSGFPYGHGERVGQEVQHDKDDKSGERFEKEKCWLRPDGSHQSGLRSCRRGRLMDGPERSTEAGVGMEPSRWSGSRRPSFWLYY